VVNDVNAEVDKTMMNDVYMFTLLWKTQI